MKKIYRYSEQKFLAFTQAKQLKIIQEMLEVLEKNFNFEEYSFALQSSLQECFSFLAKEDKSIDITWENYNLAELAEIIALRDRVLTKQGNFLKDTDIIIKRYDSVKEDSLKFPLVIIMDNLRSAFNVGSIIRSCECLGVSEIALCGKTPGVDNRKVIETSMGTLDFIKITSYESTHETILAYKKRGFEIIALELTNNSILLNNFQPTAQVAILIGNESLGLSEDTLKLCDKIVEIKMHGIKNSLNVSNATAIAIHTITKKMEENNDK